MVLSDSYLQLSTPLESDSDSLWALESRLDCPSNLHLKPEPAWLQPQDITSINHTLRITNTTASPILLKKGKELSQVRHVNFADNAGPRTQLTNTHHSATPPSVYSQPISTAVFVDPDLFLSHDIREKFKDLNLEYNDVLKPSISKYNGASGKIQAFVNMGPTLRPR